MDSLTQLTLGAAVGEVVLGKKAGNRAMLWGAVAGTIPDLDVFSGLWMSSLDTLTFHRGPTHSLLFAAVFPLVMASYTHWLYRNGYHNRRGFRIAGSVAGLAFIALVLFILGGMLHEFFGPVTMGFGLAICLPIALYFLVRIWKNYLHAPAESMDVSWKGWYWLFFWAIVTHPILDSFTVYGTQLFWPFSDMRVGWNNISVADPLYTLPLLGFLIAAALTRRGRPLRHRLNLAGLIVSSLYMAFTFYNKHQARQVFEQSLAEAGIGYDRLLTAPTILNNALWYGAAETDSFYYQGLYSFFDAERRVSLHPIAKNRHLLEGHETDATVGKLAWFSNGFYSVLRRDDGRLQINDMRYGTFRGNANTEHDYIFAFVLNERPNGGFDMEDNDPGPPEGEARDLMRELWARIFGENPEGPIRETEKSMTGESGETGG